MEQSPYLGETLAARANYSSETLYNELAGNRHNIKLLKASQ
jgi:hypothetical protein